MDELRHSRMVSVDLTCTAAINHNMHTDHDKSMYTVGNYNVALDCIPQFAPILAWPSGSGQSDVQRLLVLQLWPP